MTLKKQCIHILPLLIVVAGLFAYNFINAQWSNPTATAPGNNASTTINIGANYQAKLGDVSAIQMRAGEYCDATGLNCYTTTALSGGGGAGITQLSSGSGIILTPTIITSTGTIAIDTAYISRRVTNTCPAGQAIRQINADGTVVCQNNIATCYLEGMAYTQGSGCFVDAGSCGGSGTEYSYLSCGSDGRWTTESDCTTESNPATKFRACP
ncbi:MAG: hypothetical protein V4668_01505 [Patescibacteria group bacterium]